MVVSRLETARHDYFWRKVKQMANEKEKPGNPNQPVDPPEPQGPPTDVPPAQPRPLEGDEPGNVPIPPKAPPPPGGGG